LMKWPFPLPSAMVLAFRWTFSCCY
jgi:hypothetical protein